MRILVVDDDALNRFLLVHMLEEQGYVDCYEAENGLEAITLASRIKPDLVLLDVILPLLDGSQTAAKLKTLSVDTYLPIIFITAIDNEEALANCLEMGGDDFVTIPFNKVILSAKIRAHARTRLLSKKTAEQNKQLSFYRTAVEREHNIIEHIFANALSVSPELSDLIDFALVPESNFNGDIFLSHRSPSGGLYFLMGDFTGHGLASAIGALPVTKAFETMSRKGLSLMEMARTINSTLLQLLPDEMFFAAIMVEIGDTGRNIDVWNGGMPSLIMQNQDGRIVKRFHSRHMALGILEEKEFECQIERYEAEYGDRLVGFSDGVVEVENDFGVMLGDEGIEQWLLESPQCDTALVLANLADYQGSFVRKDDVTVVIYRCKPLPDVDHVIHASQLPLKIDICLDHELIKTSDPIFELVNLLTNHLSLYGIHSEAYTILSELYNNAVDHGLLQLNSAVKETEDGFFTYFAERNSKLEALSEGSVSIHIDYAPAHKKITITLTDSGQGFDINTLSLQDDLSKSYGRGITLLRRLCESVEFSNEGRTVKVSYLI
ncbi:MAG: SpoIIE family protein phosphatase [Paraglaciecola sp.]|nr:SpoIIE family protein phosphatase [Paraglaciecola sp.]NCT47477.1 SpoIIE family protein phosphatase [Paraglaciecola sp.]